MDIRIAVLVASIIALFFTLDSFGPGHVASWDGPAHIVRAEHFHQSLNIEMLGTGGWYHGWYLGVAPFIFYPPGMFMVLSSMKAITFGVFSMDILLRTLLAFTIAVFPIVIYWLSQKLGLPEDVSVFSAVISIGFSAIWGIGLAGTYAIGLYTNVFSLVPLMLFWGFLHQAFSKGGEKTVIISGLLLGFVVITNLVSGVFTLILMLAYLLASWLTAKNLRFKEFAAVLSLGILLSLFWTLPFTNSRDLFGGETGFNPFTISDLAWKLATGDIIYRPFVALLSVAGIIAASWHLYKRRELHYAILLTLLAVTIVVSSSLPTLQWQHSGSAILAMISRIFRAVLRTRALSFLWMILPIIAAIGADHVISRLGKDNRQKLRILFVAVVLLASFAHLGDISKENVKTTGNHEYNYRYMEWHNAFTWLRSNAYDDSAVVMTDINWDDIEPIGTISFDSLVNLESGLRTLKGNQIEATQLRTWETENVEFGNPNVVRELHKYHVGYILSYKKPLYVAPHLEIVHSSNNIVIYKTINLSGDYDLTGESLGPNKYSARLNVFRPGKIEIPVQYNDHWAAIVNGNEVPVEKGPSGPISLNLSGGINDIELLFRKKPVEYAAFVISFLSLLAALLYLYSAKFRDTAAKTSSSLRALPKSHNKK
jgi:hypothetical protein